jgi:hypothetical protein
MSERQQAPDRSGGDNRGVEEDVRSTGNEGARNAQAAPHVTDDAVHGQTQVPAPPEDVGVPSDEEIAREEKDAKDGS